VSGILGRAIYLIEGRPLLALAAGAFLLVATGFVVYWPVLDEFFALDDFVWLQSASNPSVADLFRDAFSFPESTPVDQPTPFWRPAVDAYFFAGWRVFELSATPYHVANVTLHGANAVLAAALAWRLTRKHVVAFVAGLLFVVLPTYGIAVSWVSSVTEVLAVLFYLLALVLYAAYVRDATRPRWLYGGAFAALLLALLSKESAVTLPVAMAGVALVLDTPRSWPAAVARGRELVTFGALAGAYFTFHYFQQYGSASEVQLYEFGWHALANFWEYVQWIALPVPDRRVEWLADVRPYAGVAFLVFGCAASALRPKTLGFAFGWALVALVPYLFFVDGAFPRYTYLATVPLALFAALALGEAYDALRPRAGPYATAGALAAVVLAATVFFAVEARDSQTSIATQARRYERLFDEVPALCGALPPASRIIVAGSNVFDSSGARIAMALNLRYEDAIVDTRPKRPLSASVADCVVRYEAPPGRYVRVE
jgi:hypothetical protein